MSPMDIQAWQQRAPHPFPPPWASAWGDDAHGLWADAEVSVNGPPVVQRMRWIEPGQFLMGSPQGELDAQDREHPQHQVTISQGLWLADTTCTQALWQAVMGSNHSQFIAKYKGSAEYPVNQVTWRMAQDFLHEIENLLPGCQATLPTEAEWENACRAGTTTPFSFGETVTPKQVNYDGAYAHGSGKKSDYLGPIITVKYLPPNAWGLHQMHGNVWEWCADKFLEYNVDPVSDPGLDQAMNPQVGEDEAGRVRRGGSNVSVAKDVRSATRVHLQPGEHAGNSGFRFVLRSINQTGTKPPGYLG